jgi:thiosulfate dehydrogenase
MRIDLRYLLLVACGCGPGDGPTLTEAESAELAPSSPAPADASTLPAGPHGEAIARGKELFLRTPELLPQYAPGNVSCGSCHLDGGQRPGAARLVGVHARFPKYMDRTGAVIPLHDRVNYCFTRSLSGSALPVESREMSDLLAYLAWLSVGVPVGEHVEGEGMPPMPPLTGDAQRGRALYAQKCVVCHAEDGAGRPGAFPALWGAGSYSVGASMAREERAASFIRQFMPQTAPGSLSDQEAFDLAAYINGQPRPDSPGKEGDWPTGDAPADVPYDTQGHAAYRPPPLLPRASPERAIVPAPRAVGGAE